MLIFFQTSFWTGGFYSQIQLLTYNLYLNYSTVCTYVNTIESMLFVFPRHKGVYGPWKPLQIISPIGCINLYYLGSYNPTSFTIASRRGPVIIYVYFDNLMDFKWKHIIILICISWLTGKAEFFHVFLYYWSLFF